MELGDTLDECPLPTTDSWVYFSRWNHSRLKVGWTRRPSWRPTNCFRPAHDVDAIEPLLLIADAGKNVERLIKRAAERFCARRKFGSWTKLSRELFPYSSPVLSLVGELRCVAEASFFPNVLAEKRRVCRTGLCAPSDPPAHIDAPRHVRFDRSHHFTIAIRDARAGVV
jgi:hypothetical protein